MLGLKLNHVSKRGHMYHQIFVCTVISNRRSPQKETLPNHINLTEAIYHRLVMNGQTSSTLRKQTHTIVISRLNGHNNTTKVVLSNVRIALGTLSHQLLDKMESLLLHMYM